MKTRIGLLAAIVLTLQGCAETANTPILDDSYDATTATKPYKPQGQPLEDCHTLLPEEKKTNRGCLDYESIQKADKVNKGNRKK